MANSIQADEDDEEEKADVVEPIEEVDLTMIEPSKINQFKFILDRYLQQPEDGGVSLLSSIDGYANLLSIILSNKRSEEI